ncbi:MAG: SWIM zinc finger family protein [Pyrinomonadaceae bacterium]|nr:SWIM zinc finger family protein [Pyrinomonadaceae bacterium]
MAATLIELIGDTELLRDLAGPRSYERGENYAADGYVHSITEYKGKLVATVTGTNDYQVKLWVEHDALESSCTCPMGEMGEFCKHCVATALVWADEAKSASHQRSEKKVKSNAKAGVRTGTLDDARAYLERQSKESLIELLLEHALEDKSLRERLLLDAARSNPAGLDLETYRRAIKDAVKPGRFVDYYEAGAYAHGIRKVTQELRGLLRDGHAASCIDLTEYALKQVERAIGHVDDSDGHMSYVLEDLQALHLEACQQAMLDGVKLARRLFKWELESQWEVFYGAAEVYRKVFGKEGLAEYRRLAEAEWATVPVLAPPENKEPKHAGSFPVIHKLSAEHLENAAQYGRRFRITSIMEALARTSGDVEALVAVKSRDLSSAYSFLTIAEIYREAGQQDKALEWAERGAQAFPDKTDSRLREFLAEEYHRHHRHTEAMEQVWNLYADAPNLGTYRQLKEHTARTAGKSIRKQKEEWQNWRERALSYLRAMLDERRKGIKNRGNFSAWWGAGDNSTLVEIYLWEGNIDEALKAAEAHGCPDAHWMKLAEALEKPRPSEALHIYRESLEPIIGQKNNRAYEEAVERIRKIGKLMERTGHAAEFRDFIGDLRSRHKPKRNFIKLLDYI